MSFYTIAIVIIAFLVIVGGYALMRVRAERKKLTDSLGYILFSVTLPHSTETDRSKFKEEIGAFEQFLATIKNYRHPVVMEIAVPHIGEEIHFYFAASRDEADSLERAIHSFWPEARFECVKDYNIFNIQGASIISTGTLKAHFALPLKTYRTMDADGLAAVTNAFSKLAYQGEGAAVQCVFAKTPSRANETLRSVIAEIRKGASFSQALQSSTITGKFLATFGLGSAINPKRNDQSSATPKLTESDTTRLELISQKESKTLITLNLRIAVSAANPERARSILDVFEHAFDQFADPRANHIAFKRREGVSARRAIFDFSFRNFNPSQKIILNTEEAASIIHLPTIALETPKLERIRSKTAIAPLNLPQEGIVLGKNIYRGEERVVRLLPDDKRRHLYTVGQTGTGKTTFLQEMIRQDIESGEGLCVIDPHGDLAETILGLIPAEKAQKVIYLNPTDVERPIGLNMLEFDSDHPEQKTFVINEIIEIMDKLYDLRQVGGPMFEQYLRNAMLLIMGDSILKPTILEIPKVLSDATFRRELLERCGNPSVVSFWTKEAERAGGEYKLENMVPYITSKLNPFIANDIVRPIIGQAATPFKFRDVMDQKGIIIVNLAKGVLGETNSYLLGMLIVGKILMSALSRANQPEKERVDFTLYIDEFQNVTTKTIASILAEARKYRLSMVMAHQFIAQLKEEIRDAIFGNVGTMVSFRVGTLDAEILEKQFLPVFNKQDLINLDNYHAYIKLLTRGQVSPPFNIATYSPRDPDPTLAKTVKEYSRLSYGRPREEIEQEIASRLIS